MEKISELVNYLKIQYSKIFFFILIIVVKSCKIHKQFLKINNYLIRGITNNYTSTNVLYLQCCCGACDITVMSRDVRSISS